EKFRGSKEVALHLEGNATPLPCQLATWKPQGCDAGLQTEHAAGASLGDAEEKARNIDVAQLITIPDDIGTQALDMTRKIERLADRPGWQRGRRFQSGHNKGRWF